MRVLPIFAAFLLIASNSARADKITLESERVVEGQVLQKSDEGLTVRLDHGVAKFPASMVKSVEPSDPVALVKPQGKAPGQHDARIPPWDVLTSALAKQPWATNLLPIPATVIDKGQMRFVPYSSYRCGEDYEVNLYGDPDAPAGIEIGIYRNLLKSDKAKENCIEFIASILPDPADAKAVRGLNREKAIVTRDGVTFEVTPPTADDAYGGWWVSIYDEKALDEARATPAEIAQITVPKTAKTAPANPSDTTASNDPVYDWQSSDLKRSRPSAVSSGSGGGSVYVRGYQRKDGTYVRSYTRSAPGSGGGHGRR